MNLFSVPNLLREGNLSQGNLILGIGMAIAVPVMDREVPTANKTIKFGANLFE
jgi:hypothetical protein